MLDAVREETILLARDYLVMALFTGMRRREIAGLRWADVDLKARTLTVPRPAASMSRRTRCGVCDLRTNQRFTSRERPLKRTDLDPFVAAFQPSHRRQKRVEGERFRRFAYAELAKRDRLNLDIFWLKDDGHVDPDSLPSPDEVAAEMVENLETALEKFRSVASRLARRNEPTGTGSKS